MKTKQIHNSPENFSNPFIGRDADEVWEELKAKAKPLSQKQFLKKIKIIKSKKK